MDPEYCRQAIEWKKGQDYTQGLKIYAQRYGETLTYRMLCRGQHVHNKAKLLEAIMKDVVAPAPARPAPVAKPTQLTETRPDPKPESTNDPAEIKKMKETTYGLMDERIALKQRLRELPDPQRREDRMKAALRILAITSELDTLFAKLDYFRDHGRVPQDVVLDPSHIKLPKAYLNLRTYISKALSQLRKTHDPKRKAELERLLAKYQLAMKEMETEI